MIDEVMLSHIGLNDLTVLCEWSECVLGLVLEWSGAN